MGTTFVLHASPDAVALEHECHGREATEVTALCFDQLGGPTHTTRVGVVHLVEITREQVGFLAAFGTADLDEDIFLVVGIVRQQQHLELFFEHRYAGLDAAHLFTHHLTIVELGFGENLTRGAEVRPHFGWERGPGRSYRNDSVEYSVTASMAAASR